MNADGNVSVDYLLVASGSIKQVAFCDLFFDIVDYAVQISVSVNYIVVISGL